uniref:Putative retrovirus-related Pol polyprotein n=1 Tax=Davidia involucrata TaxID=16924 RepID=A0A5B7CDG3_DAVIN
MTTNQNLNSSSSSASNPSQSPIYLLSNICNLITIRLDATNFIPWKFQISAILRAHSLMGYVDGSYVCPTKFLQSTTTENPEYHKWITHDQALMTFLNATLSSSALSQVIGYTTSKEVWQALERRFSSSSRSHVLQLKSNLHHISKGIDTIAVYVQKIKQARDNLAAVSMLIDDEDILIHTLNGLPFEYNAFKTSIRTRSQSITLEEMHTLLQVEEQTLETTTAAKTTSISSYPATMAASYSRAPN